MYKVFCTILVFLISCLSALGIDVRSSKVGGCVVAAKSDNKIFVDGMESIAFSFERQLVNTVELTLKEAGAALIEIYSGENLLYSRKGTEVCRFCAFKSIDAQDITVVITGEKVTVKSIEISHRHGSVDSFRVTSYFVASSVSSDPSLIDKKSFDIITDVILFGCVTFDESGELHTDSVLLEAALQNLHEAIGEREVKIYINLLGPEAQGSFGDWYAQMEDKAIHHSSAFKSGKLEDSVAELIEKYDFDGVFFDYEYPIKHKYWRDFNNFLTNLNQTTDKKIGLAVASWDIGLNCRSIKAVDMIELMQYDLFNENGNHSDFDTAVDGVNSIRNCFISETQVDLGLPFYGRPEDGSAVWYNYNQYAPVLGKSTDSTVTADGKTAYFNSWQSVYDKTAYAMSCGLGGVMVWHYACDVSDVGSELSLFGAISDCIADRA